MAFGYVIAQISVTNSEIYAEYIKLVLPTIEHYGGEFLVRGGNLSVMRANRLVTVTWLYVFHLIKLRMIGTTQKNTQRLKTFADLLQPVFKPL